MKSNELRLGNYILVNNNLQQVVELPLPSNCTEENTEPIPLTEEWLVKIGFEKRYSGYGAKGYKGYDFIIEDSFDICAFTDGIYYSDCGYKLKINHIHQLQNLYFALTGEELAIK